MSQRQPVVAIVEDNVSIQRALARLLSTAGWQARTFTSAEAFLHTRLQAVPDCLILDLWLPGMTGVELVEHLATKGSLLPAIIMTARDEPQMHMRALQAMVHTETRCINQCRVSGWSESFWTAYGQAE